MTDVLERTPATAPAPPDPTLDERIAESSATRRREVTRLREQARSAWAAFDGWRAVRTPEEWERTRAAAAEGYASGRWLIDRLGAERALDPVVTATLWKLRQDLVAAHGAEDDPAALMLIDLAVVTYHTALKIQHLIGNCVLLTETDLFRDGGPDPAYRKRYGHEVADGFGVEQTADKLALVLLPLFERANRGLIRNLRALRDLRAPALPAVAIGRVGQMNVGGQQVNAHVDGRNGHAPAAVPGRTPGGE